MKKHITQFNKGIKDATKITMVYNSETCKSDVSRWLKDAPKRVLNREQRRARQAAREMNASDSDSPAGGG